MSTKHTPGPWELKKTRARIEVATPARGGCYAFTHDDEANARLIASAPDLLAALQMALYELEENAWRPNARQYTAEHARAAIAQATGESC